MGSSAVDETPPIQSGHKDSELISLENLYIASSVKHFVARGIRYLQCRSCHIVIGELNYYDEQGNPLHGKEEPDLYNPFLCDCGQLAPIDFYGYEFWDLVKICDQYESEYYRSIPKPETVAGFNTIEYIEKNLIYNPGKGAVSCRTCGVLFNSELFKDDYNYPIQTERCSCGCCSNIIPEKIEEYVKAKDAENERLIRKYLEIEKDYEKFFLDQLTHSIVVSCHNGEKWGTEELPIQLIGTGESRDFCCKIKKVGFCDERHKESERVKHHFCYDRTCPMCWYAWRKREASEIVDKLEAVEELFNQLSQPVDTKLTEFESSNLDRPPEQLGPCNHYIFSPPQKWARERMNTLKGYRYMNSKLNSICKKHGIKKALKIFHPFRVRKWALKLFREDKKFGYKKGIWDWLRSKNLLSRGANAIYISPHWHLLGYGYLTNYKIFEKETKGWIYKKIPWKEKVDGKEINAKTLDRDKKQTIVNYLLSHTAVLGVRKENKNGVGRYPTNSVVWIGLTNEVEKTVKTEKTADKCRNCFNEIFEWSGWEPVEMYDPELDRTAWSFKWNPEDSHDPPTCLGFEHQIVKYVKHITYRLKKHPEIYVTYVRCDDNINEMIDLNEHQMNLDDDFG